MKTFSIVVTSILLAKFLYNPITINSWETLLLLGSGFTFFYVSGMGYTLVSFVKRYEEKEWNKIFKSCFLLFFVLGCISSVCIVLSGLFIKSMTFKLSELVLFSVYMTGTVSSTVNEYIYFLNKSFRYLILWGIFNLFVFIVAVCLPLILGFDLIYSLAALALFGLIKTLFSLRLIQNSFSLKNLHFVKPLLIFNLPVIISLLFGSGAVYFANFVIKQTVDVNAFNVFRYGSREFPIFIVLANSFSIVLGGITATKYNISNYWLEIRKSHERLLNQLFPLGCLFMLISPIVFEYVFTEAFVPAYHVFNVLLLTLVARCVFPQSLLMGLNKTKYFMLASLVEFLSGIILVLFLTPKYGIIGASWGITIAYFIEKTALIIACYKEKIAFHKSLNIQWFMIYSTILTLCYIYVEYLY